MVESKYGAPVDPLNAGLGAALGTYRTFAQMGQAPAGYGQPGYGQPTGTGTT